MTREQINYPSLARAFWFSDSKGDDNLRLHSGFRLIKARKSHQCAFWQAQDEAPHTIAKGETCITESAIYDGKFVRAYTCLACLDKYAQDVRW